MITDILEKFNTKGMSLYKLNNGISESIIYGEKYNDIKVDKNTMFSACSISRLVTSLLVLIASDEGKITLKDDINIYFKDWKLLTDDFVTFEDLLTNQSGIDDIIDSFDTYDIKIGKPSVIDIINGQTSYLKEKIIKKKDKSFIYSDSNYLLLEKLLEDIYNKDFSVIAEEKIFRPLNMRNSKYVNYENLDTVNLAYGHDQFNNQIEKSHNIYPYNSVAGLWTTSKDLGILLSQILKDYNGESILLRKETAVEMLKSHGVDFQGYGVFLTKIKDKDIFYTQGWGKGFQSYMIGVIGQLDGIVIMINNNPGVDQTKGPIGEIVKEYINELK